MTQFSHGDYVEWEQDGETRRGVWQRYILDTEEKRSAVMLGRFDTRSVITAALRKVELRTPAEIADEVDPLKVLYPAPDGFDGVQITLTFTQAIGLYKMALAMTHPEDDWTGDEDVTSLSAQLMVHLSGIVGP